MNRDERFNGYLRKTEKVDAPDHLRQFLYMIKMNVETLRFSWTKLHTLSRLELVDQMLEDLQKVRAQLSSRLPRESDNEE